MATASSAGKQHNLLCIGGEVGTDFENGDFWFSCQLHHTCW